MKKTSRMYIFAFLYRFAFLLIAVPIQALLFEGANPATVIVTYSVDFALLTLLIIWAIVRYRSIRYGTEDGVFTAKKGVSLKFADKLSLKSIDCISVTRRVLHRPFKVCQANICTAGHTSSLYLKNTDTRKLLREFAETQQDHSQKEIFRSRILSTLLMCAGFSKSLTGMLAAIPVLRNSAELIGGNLTEAVLSGLDLRGFILFAGLPPVLKLAANLLILAWAVGFTAEFLRQFGLSWGFYAGCIYTARGVFTKRFNLFRKDRVSALVISQSLPLCWLSLYSAEVLIRSADKENRLTLLTPYRRERLKNTLSKLEFLSKDEKVPNILRPHPDTLWGYTYLPMTLLTLVCVLCITADSLSTVIPPNLYLALLLVILLSVWFLFRAVAHRRAALYVTTANVIIRNYRGLTFTCALIPREKIRSVKLSESIFQRRRKNCTLRIYIHGNKQRSFSIKHISKEKAAELLSC